MELEYIVKKQDKNVMVKDIVKKKLKVSSRLFKKITGSIKLNGNNCYVTNRVDVGDKVVVNLDNAYKEEEMYSKFLKWDHDLDIIYEDEYILCVNKESYVPCHPSSSHLEKTLYNAVINYYIKRHNRVPIHFVNRLDKNTTGIVIIAKHKYVQEYLSKQMREGVLKKKYIAVVYGKMKENEGIIEKRIRRKEGSIILREVADGNGGEYAKTGYKVIGYNEKKNYTILEVRLHTGRTHQIRVHFSSIGHPLLGDELYARESGIDTKTITKYIDRQALHASEITFKDLNNKERIIRADLPYDIEKLLV